jgi:hypothetical protein
MLKTYFMVGGPPGEWVRTKVLVGEGRIIRTNTRFREAGIAGTEGAVGHEAKPPYSLLRNVINLTFDAEAGPAVRYRPDQFV